MRMRGLGGGGQWGEEGELTAVLLDSVCPVGLNNSNPTKKEANLSGPFECDIKACNKLSMVQSGSLPLGLQD